MPKPFLSQHIFIVLLLWAISCSRLWELSDEQNRKKKKTALISPIIVEEKRKLIDNILFSKSGDDKCI